jgi:hypothetical protein
MYAEQLGWAEEGVDFVISETNDYLGEALKVIQDLGLPAMVTLAPTQPRLTRDVRAMAEALGRVVPASRYSPSMGLHPMFRTDVAAKDAAFLPSWNALGHGRAVLRRGEPRVSLR